LQAEERMYTENTRKRKKEKANEEENE